MRTGKLQNVLKRTGTLGFQFLPGIPVDAVHAEPGSNLGFRETTIVPRERVLVVSWWQSRISVFELSCSSAGAGQRVWTFDILLISMLHCTILTI